MKKLKIWIAVTIIICLYANKGLSISMQTDSVPALGETGYIDSGYRLHLFYRRAGTNFIYEAIYNSVTQTWQYHIPMRIRNLSRIGSQISPHVIDLQNVITTVGEDNVLTHWVRKRRTYHSPEHWHGSKVINIPRESDRVTTESRTTKRPSGLNHTWDLVYPPYPSHTTTVVFMHPEDHTIRYQAAKTYTGEVSWYNPEGIRNWRFSRKLTAENNREISTNSGPSTTAYNGRLVVAYRGRNSQDNQVLIAVHKDNRMGNYGVDTVALPGALTDESPELINYKDGLLVAHTGLHDDRIWILQYLPQNGNILDAASWRQLGYAESPNLSLRTALAPELRTVANRRHGLYTERTLFLAIRPVNSREICVGMLEIDESNDANTPGHRWISLRNDTLTECNAPLQLWQPPFGWGGQWR